ncbi:hypothetical protein BD309DRAFT_851654 [Dichomitus squalens]|uniref:Uncharacterized protein n=1 Tax=Dichomitus squalens TaxID=114155 RepID=A0A4Q9QAG2_9APHY|nr:hypothetical protein BD309DRAFT_851654 [Dichomitus squalens]TBU64051.1 hypothetical protein BD310DRAFT_973088 [Dichomitus squalens]
MSLSRSLSLAGSLLGAVCNLAFALRLLTLSRSLGWESESEWEGSVDVWAVDSVRLVWGLLFAYFAAAAASCSIGFIGIAKHVRPFVRIYRDYSIADFVFVTLATLGVSYTTFSKPYVRSSVCEELSRHPELMRDMGEMGLSLENCEQWFERAVVAVLGIMFILIVVRLHIVIALSQYYSYISRELLAGVRSHILGMRAIKTDVPLQRIYLMPTPTSPSASSDGRSHHFSTPTKDITVYATVPIGAMSEEDARKMHATPAWITTSPVASSSSTPRSHRHSHSHSHSHARPHTHSHRHASSRTLSDEKAPTPA